MTPSKRRREGRRAFHPGEDPHMLNPYLNTKLFGAKTYSAEWMDGWIQAEAAWELAQEGLMEAVFCPHCGNEIIKES